MDDLLAWVSKRPDWQQDALRRLAEKRELVSSDLVELQQRIEQANGLASSPPVTLHPLKKEHLRKEIAMAPTTILGSIGPVRNVDRLAPDQNPLQFAINGITLVYGANGSGKSGYCRLIKKLCRSLHDAPLRSNVYDADTKGPPEVAVAFKVYGEASTRELVWRQPDSPPPELSRISVFDTHAAGLYVDGDRNIEFLPRELDLLNRLAFVMLDLEDRFSARERTLQAAVRAPLPTGYTSGTDVSTAVAKLVTASAIDQFPSEQALRELATWKGEDEERLTILSRDLRNDPGTLAEARRRMKTTLETLAGEIVSMGKTLSDASVEDLRTKGSDARKKREIARATAKVSFKDEPIKDLGSDTWRQMLIYAREFSAEAYADFGPPRIATGPVCMLCQQDLTPTARERLARFDAYIEGRANKDAETAEQGLSRATKGFLDLSVRRAADIASLLSSFSELDEERKQLAATIMSFIEAAGKRHAIIVGAVGHAECDKIRKLEPLPDAPAEAMTTMASRLQIEADAYDRQKQDDGERKRLRSELANLADRKRFSTEIETIIERRKKLEELKRVSACKGACSTTGVTQKITKLRKDTLTPSLQRSLEEEIDAFDLHHLPLKIADWGEQGESKVKIDLGAVQRIAKNSDILSDGEQRALALAGFLAELKEIGSTHGIVVDDPVSSLDLSRLEAVAKRLVQEAAKGRQVIVFTHNITFHYSVRSHAREAKVPVRTEWIARKGADLFGIIDEQQKPWLTLPVMERIAKIRNEINVLEKGYDPADEAHRRDIVGIYTMMRETWERLVEEILFNEVVERFRPDVRTLKLRAARIDDNDYEAVHGGMTRCSRYSGHDHPKEAPPALPTIKATLEELSQLETHAAEARRRKKALEAKGKAFEEGPVAEVLDRAASASQQ